MDGVVEFDEFEFMSMYPDLSDNAGCSSGMYFKAACLLLDNTPSSPVKDVNERKLLLYMLMCHIAELKKRGDGIVGTITSAAEGNVNVSVTPLTNANWYTQTVCGAMYWQATAKYRVGMRYYVPSRS